MLDLKGVRGPQAHKRAYELLERVGLADKFDVVPPTSVAGKSSASRSPGRWPAIPRSFWPTSPRPRSIHIPGGPSWR